MPAKFFICPDNEKIEITKCLQKCRLGNRCATKAYLEMVGYDRQWKGVSPSSAGTGVRQLYLKATTNYAIKPNDRAFAALGTAVHAKLSIQKYNRNILSEEPLSDNQMKGIADCLEMDENKQEHYILTDYKTSGSYAVAQWLGISKESQPLLDEDGKPVLLKSGKNKGQPKTKAVFVKKEADLKNVSLQLNRYRIFFEKAGFPISRIQVQAIVRDGGTYIAQSRGINDNIYIVPIPRLADDYVIGYYDQKINEMALAYEWGYCKKCTDEERWSGRRCEKYCEVSEACKNMDSTLLRRLYNGGKTKNFRRYEKRIA